MRQGGQTVSVLHMSGHTCGLQTVTVKTVLHMPGHTCGLQTVTVLHMSGHTCGPPNAQTHVQGT